MRFESDGQTIALLTPDGMSQLAVVLDESFGGMGLIVADATGLDAGCELQVIYHGAPMWGVVRVVQPDPDGGFYVGVEWCSRKERAAICPSAASPAAAPVTARAPKS